MLQYTRAFLFDIYESIFIRIIIIEYKFIIYLKIP